ncbi:MAG: sigma-70 family RNA polymerase sigma factor [Propionibacteriaceae bacterium]|nr:sigma-70 family RNA polymerase sigma factor [Propionibacteriaceae bacterium]
MSALPLEAEVSAETPDVVARFSGMVYSIALTHTKSRGDADDVFQEVFLTYHRKQPECVDDEHRKAWLIKTTLNCARRAVADSWRTRVVPIRPADMDMLADTAFTFATAEQDAIFAAVSKLSEVYRSVLHLFYFEDLPIAKIATLLGLEQGAVKVRLSRGRALLREQLGGYFDD